MTDRSLIEKNETTAGLAALFGIAIQTAQRDRVAATMRIEPDHLTPDDAVYGGVLTALADCASAHGAALSLPKGHMASAIDTQANFLRRGDGESLDAIATPLHAGRTTSVWRTVIRRGKGRPIAEITQTHLILPKKAERRRPVLVASNTTADASTVPEERKRQIFEGASRVIAEKGFAGASIRDIAAAAGMPVPTMYQYIERKEDLLFLIYESFLRDYAENLRRAVEAAPSPAEKLRAAVAATLDNFDRNHTYIKLMFQETRALSAEGRRRVYELDARYIRVWTSILSNIAGRNGGAQVDPELLANLVYFLCTVWPLRYWTIGKFGRPQVEDAIASLLKGGLGLGPER
ncbi:MAG: hotdog fold thioesterase [Alphaproteobacteria bacterium]